MKLPHITKKQQELLVLLYRYRFINTRQLELLLHLKDKKRMGVWLKDLREKGYVEWIYTASLEEKRKPAVYYLALNGIRYITSLNTYPITEIRKRYKESTRKHDFIAKSLLLVDCAIHLDVRNSSSDELEYTFATRADYVDPESDYYFLTEPKPDLFIEKQEDVAGKTITTHYLIHIFDTTTPRYTVRKQLKDYVMYLYDGDWRQELDCDELITHVVCPTKADLIYAKRRTHLLLGDIGQENDTHIRFATLDKVKQYGATGMIWEEVN